ncbi:putative lysosomal cobalamin transporter [Camelus ferus]|nr:putative lysosomal cobalamin transporter [Camelus ferus]
MHLSSSCPTETVLEVISDMAILAFCWIYVRKYQSQRESEVVSTITAIFSLAIALITSALLPVDIFLVSYMKNQNGTFKDWANANVSRQIEDTVLYGYYMNAGVDNGEILYPTQGSFKAVVLSSSLVFLSLRSETLPLLDADFGTVTLALYSVILFCVFFWIPFVYFYYEEKDDDDTGKCTQIKTALKYTLGFVVICALLLLVGAFVPLNVPNNKNSTEWEKVKFLFEELGSSQELYFPRMEKARLTDVDKTIRGPYDVNQKDMEETLNRKPDVNSSSIVIGENVNYEKAYGMSALPLNLIKGTRSAVYERLENTEDIEEVEQHIQTIKAKSKDGRPLAARDKRALKQFEERLRTLRKRERHLEFIENSWWTKFCGALRPLKSNITYDEHKGNSTLSVPKRCDAEAPEDQCTVTRTYLFLHKFWFFSAAYYFGNWAFLGVFLIGLIVSCCKGKKSVIEGVDEDDSDLSEDEPSVYAA